MLTGKVTGEGQVTIPPEVRQKLGIREGDVLRYDLEPGGVKISKLPAFDAAWHAALSGTVADEWDSAEDDAAFADLQPGASRSQTP